MAAGHRRRLMKKVFDNGIETLLEHEFLELCLFSVFKRCDTNPIAHSLLDKFGSLDAVCSASEKELKTVEGIGPAAAEQIRLIPYISKGYSIHTSIRKNKIFKTRKAICERCVALLGGEKNEVAYILCFDNKYHLIKEVRLAEGDPGKVSIEPRKIMDAIAQTSTTSVALCHNHPSGFLSPSRMDFTATNNIKVFLKSINVDLIDHVVVVDGKYISCITSENMEEEFI